MFFSKNYMKIVFHILQKIHFVVSSKGLKSDCLLPDSTFFRAKTILMGLHTGIKHPHF